VEREEFVDYWAYKWSDLLAGLEQKLRPTPFAPLQWIRDQRESEQALGHFAREIFTTSANRQMG